MTEETLGHPDATQSAPALPAITLDRVGGVLGANGDRFEVLAPDTIGTGWEDSSFWFQLMGDDRDVLHAQGRWRGILPSEQIPTGLAECNAWNSSAPFVRCYLTVSAENDGAWVDSSAYLDCSDGVTEAQLTRFMNTAIHGGSFFFSQVVESLSE